VVLRDIIPEYRFGAKEWFSKKTELRNGFYALENVGVHMVMVMRQSESC